MPDNVMRLTKGVTHMSAVIEISSACLSDQAWEKLAHLESLHQSVQANHEKVVSSLNAAIFADDRSSLQIAWNQYRSVVADLGRVTEDIESLRLSAG